METHQVAVPSLSHHLSPAYHHLEKDYTTKKREKTERTVQ